jgi:uncharacterized membrane protein
MFKRIIILVLCSLPIMLLLPLTSIMALVLLYLLIPVFLLLRYVLRNLHWGERTEEKRRRRPSRSARILREQRRQEAILKSLNLDPDEERIAREQLAAATLRKLGEMQ